MTHITFVSAVCVAALGIAFSPARAQNSGSVRGTVTDSITGAPVIGARVAAMCEGCYGRQPTDSLGRYTLIRIPIGANRIEFHCPSRTVLGRELARRTVAVVAGQESVLDVRVPPGGCYELVYSERVGIFRGVWTPGFESSAFVPCADSALGVASELLPGKRLVGTRAWAELTTSARVNSPARPKRAPRDAWGNPRYFVVWRGILKGPGTYGHMGVSEFMMMVDSVLTIRASAKDDCSRR
jgi:hypothetical protein